MTALDPAYLRILHDRLLTGDRDAPDRIVSECAPQLQRLLRRRCFALPPEALSDAANDALLSYFARPERYVPDRLPLLSYLTLLADRRLVDLFRRNTRECKRLEFVGGPVELAARESKNRIEEPPAVDDPYHLPPEVQAWIDATLPDPADRAFVNLMCEGEHSTEVFAAVLGLDSLPKKERAVAVKRNRDRILKRLQRRREELREMSRCNDD